MDLSAGSIEDLLDRVAAATPVVTVWLSGQTVTSTRLVTWIRQEGTIVCRGGNGFTEDDLHYFRVGQIQGLTVRAPAASSSRAEADRIGNEIREALRHAAGYPLGVTVRPDAFAGAPGELTAWLETVVAAIGMLGPLHDNLQMQVDQILLRDGQTPAVLGGSTLILEATPGAIPAPEDLAAAIQPLLF